MPQISMSRLLMKQNKIGKLNTPGVNKKEPNFSDTDTYVFNMVTEQSAKFLF